MDGKLDTIAQKRLVELTSKEALAADLVQRLVQLLVTLGSDDFDFDWRPTVRLER
jgi:hypothetical protein